MRTIGRYLKEERIKKNLSLKQLEKDTKIKKTFIDLIEKGNWEDLPEYPIILGFVKTIAKSLDISEQAAVATLRRDYPFDEKKVTVNPKPDLKLRLSVSPKIIIAVLSSLLVFAFLGYILYQYLQYVSPPRIDVIRPIEGQKVTVGELMVTGTADDDATLTVNNQRMLVADTGEFSGNIEVGENTRQIVFVAKSRYGKETVIVRNITPVVK